ncbi:MAG: hypothetical protein M3Y79_15100, partial [Pseudomonadota bacterium]|nr:hypothetical protein [Pseudomonadota bacterium]
TAVQPTFVAPNVTSAITLRFSLVVTDDLGAKSSAATVAITVSSSTAGTVSLTGQVRFERVNFVPGPPYGLNYAAPMLQPARGVTVRVLNAGSLALYQEGATDASGNFSIAVPGDTDVVLQVVASMQRTSGPGPRWNVRVQNGTGNLAPYSYSSAAFNTSVGSQNINIPTGLLPTGVPISGQHSISGPFAILDSIYTAMQAVSSAEPDIEFPALYVDWGTQNRGVGSGTFFTGTNGQHIALLSDPTEDTDEFDQHVVAHEFGHYIENNFSRSDSIGGPHGLGDRLDMRVAFGEGFGYAFAAIVLNDPDARDSFVSGGTQAAGRFVVETDPPAGGSGAGCWCSETSVWSILWDLYDPVGEVNDSVAMGFAPIWEVMTGAQRTTPAMTSIFSFAAALKVVRPEDVAGIDALLTAQNITAAGIEPFAGTQANTPFTDMLPLYRTITPALAVNVTNTGTRTPERLYNKAGNRTFLRFVPTTSGSVNISVVTSNTNVSPAAADPDFWVFRNGVPVAAAQDSPLDEPARTENGTLSVTAGQTYIIDAYDCANGCAADPVQGIAGNYILTVTVTPQ